MEETEETVEESFEDEDIDGAEDEGGEEAPAPAAAPEPEEGEVESSLEELLAKREGPAEEEEDDDSVLALGREERLEPLAVKVVPPSDKEFVCRNCHLVKHRAQLADKVRMFCRDCA
jgi:hypothetical protein